MRQRVAARILSLNLALLGLAATAHAGPPSWVPTQDTRAGVVAEALPAGSYCYVRLVDDEAWLATMGGCPATGVALSAQIFGWRAPFESPRLGRTFPRVGFAHLTLAAEVSR